MVKVLAASDYLDVVYERGLHVVLLYCDDDSRLGVRAVHSLEPVDSRFHGSRNVHLWVCRIETPEDAEAVQVARLPQYRFFLNGSEKHSHVGVMDSEEILHRMFAIEEV
jgi:hypothetical protein